MNSIANQLRTNAAAIMVPHAKDGMPEAAIAGALIMAAEEIERLDDEAQHNYRLIVSQGRKLTGVVDAIRGTPPALLMHSVHDAAELARKAMAVVHAARAYRSMQTGTAVEVIAAGARLDESLSAMPLPEIACPECDNGKTMEMRCYGGPPHEVEVDCENCSGHGFVTDTKPLTDPGTPLPGWEEVCRKAERGEALTPVEAFIMRLTPGDDARAEDFRRMLRAALDSVKP